MLRTSPCTRRQFLSRSAAAAAAGLLVARVPAPAGEPPLPYFEQRGWLVGCWTRPWAAFDYRVGMDAMAEAGFKHIALTGAKTRTRRVIAAETTLEEAAEVGQEAQRRGLTITNVYGGGVSLEKGPAGLRKLIDNCQAARTSRCCCPGSATSGRTRRAAERLPNAATMRPRSESRWCSSRMAG